MLNRAPLSDVKILPGLFKSRMKLNEDYLMELDSVCLLQNFYLEAGIQLPGMQVVPDPAKAKLHWGWEAPSCQLRGHFLGHWLSAAAALCANEEKPQLRAKLDGIVSELARYTMHKTIMGLKDVWDLLGNSTAIDILDRLADWYIRWVDSVQASNPDAVFSGEQAGMLEVWGDLYALTGKEKYKKLMDAYEGNALFDRLDKGVDALSDDHANASIPVSHGAGRLYEITKDEKWKRRMEAFWKTAVEDRGMFATTGSNAGEFWIPLKSHSRFLCATDQVSTAGQGTPAMRTISNGPFTTASWPSRTGKPACRPISCPWRREAGKPGAAAPGTSGAASAPWFRPRRFTRP